LLAHRICGRKDIAPLRPARPRPNEAHHARLVDLSAQQAKFVLGLSTLRGVVFSQSLPRRPPSACVGFGSAPSIAPRILQVLRGRAASMPKPSVVVLLSARALSGHVFLEPARACLGPVEQVTACVGSLPLKNLEVERASICPGLRENIFGLWVASTEDLLVSPFPVVRRAFVVGSSWWCYEDAVMLHRSLRGRLCLLLEAQGSATTKGHLGGSHSGFPEGSTRKLPIPEVAHVTESGSMLRCSLPGKFRIYMHECVLWARLRAARKFIVRRRAHAP